MDMDKGLQTARGHIDRVVNTMERRIDLDVNSYADRSEPRWRRDKSNQGYETHESKREREREGWPFGSINASVYRRGNTAMAQSERSLNNQGRQPRDQEPGRKTLGDKEKTDY